ncbi:hypothetical protein OJ997_13330 [Solirubrobacter phytolaccae]|uniref:Uncharacterized protein n=1 Tax=Solirubrobacter phytolaccae TaxID=1404360 RepID=A0A9X3N7Q1_9ACTN|nr:hypothetical protein [Solirubrobacter phytolaccae]MDA0181283.1 hypothetical protein [Solirubrobacter phytolaccae]
MSHESGILSAQDSVALLKEGIAVLSVQDHEGRVQVGVVGRDEEYVRRRVTERLGDVDVWVVGDVARQLRPRAASAYMERAPGLLQLRYLIQGDQHVDEIVTAEDDETVVVCGCVCMSVIGDHGEPIDFPAHAALERPLGDRVVIDGVSGEPLPFRNVYEGIGEPLG